MSYKQRHEQFVSDLTGGSIWEVNAVTLVAVASLFCWSVLQASFRCFDTRPASAHLLPMLADYLLNWYGVLLSVTLYSGRPVLLNLLVALPALLLLPLAKKGRSKDKPKAQTAASKDTGLLPRHAFLTSYRGGMIALTCIAILAVDFPLFPRRFAKVETWGTSLMDLGVGSFVFSMGLVSARRLLVAAVSTGTAPKTTRFAALRHSLKKASPILALGIIRMLLVKLVDYHEHVSEYGVHWNFFLTLGFLPPFVTLCGFVANRIPLAVSALIVAISYEAVLTHTGLLAWVLAAPRTNIISMNKEGICSFFGFLAIFLSGEATGIYCLPQNVSWKSFLFPRAPDKTSSRRAPRVIAMLLLSALFHGALFSICSAQVSRRLANLPYVLWVVTYNTSMLALYVIIDALLNSAGDYQVPASLQAVNSNGLLIFLLANVATGVVNLIVKTIDASVFEAMVVLTLYTATLYSLSMFLWHKGIVLKL